MNIGFWSFYEESCYNNKRFLSPHVGPQENCSRKYFDLYRIGKNQDIHFKSLDTCENFDELDCFLFADFPRMRNELVRRAFSTKKPRFLILEESEVVYPSNWDLKKHALFDKIFTWHDGFVDNKKYFKFNVYYIEKRKFSDNLSHKEKLLTLISGNKKSSHPKELYSKRVEAVRWFEKHHPEDFDLYGRGWDLLVFSMDRWQRYLNSRKLIFPRRLLGPNYPSWKGEVKEKRPIIEKYWFYLAYDNARDIPGYILEKIHDSFFAGTVPVYWGATNIKDYIPGECFIDKREFDTYEDLYDFLKGMKTTEYLQYLKHIELFLNTDLSYPFTSECFSKTVMSVISDALRKA